MLPNVTGLLMHKTNPIAMLRTEHHTGSTERQTEPLQGRSDKVSVLEDLQFPDNHHWSRLRQAALGLALASSPFC